MTISKELLDELLSGVERPEDLLGDKGLMKELKVRLMERMLGAELTQHLGYEPHGEPDSQQTNRRNGASRKVLKGNDGAVPINIPRDRDGSFEPELIPKGQTRIDGMDDKIIGLYAAGLSTRDIRAHLEEVYGLKVSADLISRVTDAVLEEVSDWQNRALEPMYPIVFLDALRVKIRDAESRQVKNKAVYVALGVTPEGEREVLGLWIANNEGAKFWLSVMNNLRNRGVEDILIAVVPSHRCKQRLPGNRRPQRLPRRHQRRVPRDHSSNLHRASGAPFPELLRLEGPQECRQGFKAGLSGHR